MIVALATGTEPNTAWATSHPFHVRGVRYSTRRSAEYGTEIAGTGTMAQPVREAALKPSAANSYPYLPARMWTPARRLAELVAKDRGLPAQALDRLNRVLSDQDFMFRGGGGPATV